MRKKLFLSLFLAFSIAIGCADGAVRSASSPSRTQQTTKTSATSPRSVTTPARKQQTTKSTTRSTTKSVQKSNVRSAIPQASATTQQSRQVKSARSAIQQKNTKRIVGRAATTTSSDMTLAFGADYDKCHDAYFTCMDQFCASIDDTYRRCICSSRLSEIKQKQSAIAQSSDSLAAFQDLNMEVIKKSAAEVQAMTSATAGEQIATSAKDTSNSAKQLTAIGDVLSQAKSKALSTGGTLDAGGNIKSIWSTTDIANGANIANLTGESLYNAVNAQCSEMVADQCPESTLNIVISAYGMYIENDCATLANNLTKQKNAANSAIRETGHQMNVARLENYDAHNSLPINDCISNIRQDITAPTACGTDFVHCLDHSGLYLNIDTGEPIYSKNFYNLENQISLSGNILNNQKNNSIITYLNTKKKFAAGTLDKCRDLSSDIWDEFMRQSIIEIYQKQQEKIRKVKTECLNAVNQCYDSRSTQLKDFSSVTDKTLLGLNQETVEALCKEKLDTCSNLYGGGPDGLEILVDTMHDITDQRIVAECQNFLTDFGNNLCAVQTSDTLHSYPYACRVYAPGDQQYATNSACNDASANIPACGDDYVNSLYHQFVKYALQVCIRPSEYETLKQEIPTLVLQDVNIVMNKMRISMGNELSKECERLGGIWVTTPYNESDSTIQLQDQFYTETGSNKKWGYCKTQPTAVETYLVTLNYGTTTITTTLGTGENQTTDDNTYTINVQYGAEMPTVQIPKYQNTDDTFATFGGYFSEPNGGGTQYYDENGVSKHNWNVASNATLYAKWVKTYTITLNSEYKENDTTICSGNTQQITVTADNEMPTLSEGVPAECEYIDTANNNRNTKYAFTGYYYEPSNTKYYNADGTSAHVYDLDQSDVTLQAQFVEKVPITLECNHNCCSPSSPNVVYATPGQPMPAISKPSINFGPGNGCQTANDFYVFQGYFTAQSGGIQYYNARGKSVHTYGTGQEATTLYAQWIMGSTGGSVTPNNPYINGENEGENESMTGSNGGGGNSGFIME